MNVQITLRSDDAEQFEDLRDRLAEQRDGNEPSRPETVRLLMQETSY